MSPREMQAMTQILNKDELLEMYHILVQHGAKKSQNSNGVFFCWEDLNESCQEALYRFFTFAKNTLSLDRS